MPDGIDSERNDVEQPVSRLEGLRDLIERHLTTRAILRWGVGSVDPYSDTLSHLLARVDSGLSGGMGMTFTRPNESTDLRRSFPWARSVVTAGSPYTPGPGRSERKPGMGRIAGYAAPDAYLPLRNVLDSLAQMLISSGWKAVVLVDSPLLVDRAAAVRSGVGWSGRSTMVIAPGVGPWMVLGSVVTDADIETDDPMVRNCGKCVACVEACPTGAISIEGTLDVRKCLAAILQRGGDIPTEYRGTIGDRVYGCEDCLVACPPGKRVERISSKHEGSVDLREILLASDEALLKRYGHFYFPGRSPKSLRRNALIAAGNNPTAELLEVVEGYQRHPKAMLRRHAAWALSKIEGGDPILRQARNSERDPSVLEAIDQALDPSGK